MLYLDIDQPALGTHFWRIIDDSLEDDNVISEGQCSSEEDAIQEGNEELQRLNNDYAVT